VLGRINSGDPLQPSGNPFSNGGINWIGTGIYLAPEGNRTGKARHKANPYKLSVLEYKRGAERKCEVNFKQRITLQYPPA